VEITCMGRHCADSINLSIGLLILLTVAGSILLVRFLVSREDKNEK